LAKELVEAYHGSISAASDPGKTTEFTVRLPVARTHFESNEIAERAWTDSDHAALLDSVPISTGPRETASVSSSPAEPDQDTVILLVEDHAEVRDFIRSHLGSEYRVLEAGDGKAGLATAVSEIPDLIISDVMMPEMDGFELCRALKKNEKTSHIPVILLTARAAEESRIEGFQTGADEYLVKPFSAAELQARVKNLVNSRRELRKRFSTEMLLQPEGVVVTSANASFLTRAMEAIESRLGDESFGVQDLSNALAMTPRQLNRKLTALANQSPNEFIRSFRLHRARQLLEQEAGTVSEIAYRVGFGNLSYFSRCFKEQFHVLPSEVHSDSEQP
jgi:CheY-like chemotaxis protein/AraC-like DNA-binding protein